MFSWDMIVLLFSAFFSLYLVFGMLVIARKRYLFLLEWSFCFLRGTVFYPSSIQTAVFICLTAWRIGERDFLFLSKLGPLRYYGPCFFSVSLRFFYYCNIPDEEREAGKNESCRKETKRDGNSTLQFNVNEHLFYL
jgi:hypothetical protein